MFRSFKLSTGEEYDCKNEQVHFINQEKTFPTNIHTLSRIWRRLILIQLMSFEKIYVHFVKEKINFVEIILVLQVQKKQFERFERSSKTVKNDLAFVQNFFLFSFFFSSLSWQKLFFLL